MIDQQVIEDLAPLALEWAARQEKFILARGSPLGRQALTDARRVGVQEPARVRVLVVEKIALPDLPELAAASRRAHIITDASGGVAFGYGIILRADRWGDRELLVHQLAHVAQCERAGGIGQFVPQYLTDRRTCADFTVGSLEDEARRLAREVCTA
ncbi:MAG: hypothetical protein M3Y86_05190 [Verrucomicrobiota bacterium]|nr:hypothetical protein [Verrucomicrobiota bacterium]